MSTRQSAAPTTGISAIQQLITNFYFDYSGGSAQIHLFQGGPPTITPASAIADFLECDFPSYAPQNLAFNPTWQLTPDGASAVVTQLFHWRLSALSTDVPQSALGYWVDDGLGALIAAEYFVDPVLFTEPGDWVNLLWQFPFTFTVPTV